MQFMHLMLPPNSGVHTHMFLALYTCMHTSRPANQYIPDQIVDFYGEEVFHAPEMSLCGLMSQILLKINIS